MSVTVSFISLPPIVSLQGNPCLIKATSSLAAEVETDINIHLVIQQYTDGAWSDTDYEDILPIVDDIVIFDISGYFEGQLSSGFSFPENSTNLIIPHAGMIKKFKVKIWEEYTNTDGDAITTEDAAVTNDDTLYLLIGGISDDDLAILDENSSNWWLEHLESERALNWIPGDKTISENSIEKLYWIQGSDETISLVFDYTDTDGNTGSYNYSFDLSAYTPYEFSVSPALLQELTDLEIAEYTVSISGKSFSQKYVIDRNEYEWQEYFLLANSFGAYEGLWCKGGRTMTGNYNRISYEKANQRNLYYFDRTSGNIRSKLTRTYESNTGFIDDDNWTDWLLDLLNSDDAYKIKQENIYPIVLSSDSIDAIDEQDEVENLRSISFEWEYARSGKYFSKMGLVPSAIVPPYYNKLVAFFSRFRDNEYQDLERDYSATLSSSTITFPEIESLDIFDFSDETYWDQDLIAATSWYDSENPRSCPLSWLIQTTWAPVATSETLSALFHKDYSSAARDILPVLVYSGLTEAEQKAVTKWLDWYMVVFSNGSYVTSDSKVVITKDI